MDKDLADSRLVQYFVQQAHRRQAALSCACCIVDCRQYGATDATAPLGAAARSCHMQSLSNAPQHAIGVAQKDHALQLLRSGR